MHGDLGSEGGKKSIAGINYAVKWVNKEEFDRMHSIEASFLHRNLGLEGWLHYLLHNKNLILLKRYLLCKCAKIDSCERQLKLGILSLCAEPYYPTTETLSQKTDTIEIMRIDVDNTGFTNVGAKYICCSTKSQAHKRSQNRGYSMLFMHSTRRQNRMSTST